MMDESSGKKIESEQNKASVELYVEIDKLIQKYGGKLTTRDILGLFDILKHNLLRSGEQLTRDMEDKKNIGGNNIYQ